MALFKKKPVVVDAYQITEEMVAACVFDGLKYPAGLSLSSASYHQPDRRINNWHGTVVTIHGQQTSVTIGDWIISENDGEHFYQCKPDIFSKTYEPIGTIEGLSLGPLPDTQEQGWRDIEDGLPCIWQTVLLCINGVVQKETFLLDSADTSDYAPSEYFWSRDNLDDCPSIKKGQFWRPLPAPPEVKP